MLSAESSRQVWQTCMWGKALFGCRCSQMLPEGTEVELLPGGETMLSSGYGQEMLRLQVQQVWMWWEGVFGCRIQMLLSEGKKTDMLPSG